MRTTGALLPPPFEGEEDELAQYRPAVTFSSLCSAGSAVVPKKAVSSAPKGSMAKPPASVLTTIVSW